MNIKKFSKKISVAFIAFLVLILAGPINTYAVATTPSLGTASTYGILSNTFTRNIGLTSVAGDGGYTTLSGGGTDTISGTTSQPATPQSGIDQGTALSILNAQPCDFNYGSPTDLSTLSPLVPGVYCITAAASIGVGGLNLNGAGTYIFRISGALTSVATSSVTVSGGASACDVFWTPTSLTTLGANTAFIGTIIDNSGITIGSTTTVNGRALAFGGTVTTDTDAITVPSCGAPPASATLHVFKQVIGGTATPSLFNLHVKISGGGDVGGSPAVGSATGTVYSVPAGSYTVSEDVNTSYVASFSGDCDAAGNIPLGSGDNKTCTITNTYPSVIPPVTSGSPMYIAPTPPLIDVVKVPSPLSLPNGPGLVTYTYTLRNIGTVPVGNVTMVDDSCSPLTLVSGDTNSDNKVDMNETWIYRCSATLAKTHTNTVVATGWANGISVSDIANSTVVVGVPVVAPLIHVTKVPSSLTLGAGGGPIVYSEKITNPGTVALSNVNIADNKCSPTQYVSGDINSDSKLNPSETWSYTCQTNLTSTTTNTVVATGTANGLTARDVAIATVVVAPAVVATTPVTPVVPTLPNTGLYPVGEGTLWNVAMIAMIFLVSISLVLFFKKTKA